MNGMVKNVVVLTVITVIAGFCLGYVKDITDPLIKEQEATKKQEAYLSVFDNASSFAEDASIDLSQAADILANASYDSESIDEALAALDGSGNVIGYVMTVTTGRGYGGDITITMGVDNEGTLKGIEILSISETAGLGMNADTDEFKSQFRNKNVAMFKYTKTGATTDYEIDALSGATITTNAMTNAVNAGLAYAESLRGGANNE